jgi:26S proteasome regulatory subunit N2
MEAVVDTNFSLSYRNHVLNFLLPLFPPIEARSSHIHAVTRLLVSLSDASLTVPYLVALVPKEKLLSYQLAFDLVEGGSQDFLEAIRSELPEGDEVCFNSDECEAQD